MTIESSRAFPKGVPQEFSFECTFRLPQPQPILEEWYLFELSDYEYHSQMNVKLLPLENTIEFSLPKYDGSIQTVTFEETEVYLGNKIRNFNPQFYLPIYRFSIVLGTK